MITWLISSFFLSSLGALLYLAFRRHFITPAGRKKLVYTILLGSLGLPLVLGQLSPFHAVQQQVQQPILANTVEEYCHCQDPQASEKLLFEAARGYEFLLHNQSLIIWGMLGIAGLMLGFLGIKMAWLFWLSRGQAQDVEFEGYRFRQVKGSQRMPAGSFRLLRKYMLWHEGLNSLTSQEQSAIRWHEISHLRQANTYENLLLGVLQALWFFNPAFYFFRAELKKLSEYLADDLAVAKTGNPKQYATLLVKLRSAAWQPGVSALSNQQLKSRIVRLVAQSPTRKRSPLFFWLFFLLSFPLTGFSTQQVVETEIQELQTYAYMSSQYQEKGTTEFCKRCTYESGEQMVLFSLLSK